MSGKKLQTLQLEKIVNNNNTQIENVWLSHKKRGKKLKNKAKIIDKLQDAQSILIFGKFYPDLDIDETLRMKFNASDCNTMMIIDHKFKENLIKQRPEHAFIKFAENIDMSFIIIDHQTAPKGYFIISGTNDWEYCISLNIKQIVDLVNYFVRKFWFDTVDEELYFGNYRKKSIGIQNANALLKSLEKIENKVLQKFNADLLDSFDVDHVEIPYYLIDLLEDNLFYNKANSILLDQGKNLYNFVEENLIDTNAKLSMGDVSLGLLGGEKSYYLFNKEIILKISKSQYIAIRDTSNIAWEFTKNTRINELTDQFFLQSEFKGTVENIKRNIRAETTSQLEDITLSSIDDYIEEFRKYEASQDNIQPSIPEDLHFANNIRYTWKIVPPRPPNGSKKHKVYDKWPKCFSAHRKLHTKFESILKKIEEIMQQNEIKKNKDISKRWKSVKSEIVKFKKVQEETLINIDKMEKNIAIAINYINVDNRSNYIKGVKKYNAILETLLHQIIDFGKFIQSKEDQLKPIHNEADMNDPKKNKISKELINIFKDLKKIQKTNLRDVVLAEEEIPKFVPPQSGLLYSHRGELYLCIENFEDIELAKKERIIYENAKIVTKENA